MQLLLDDAIDSGAVPPALSNDATCDRAFGSCDQFADGDFLLTGQRGNSRTVTL